MEGITVPPGSKSSGALASSGDEDRTRAKRPKLIALQVMIIFVFDYSIILFDYTFNPQ